MVFLERLRLREAFKGVMAEHVSPLSIATLHGWLAQLQSRAFQCGFISKHGRGVRNGRL